ncbi:MAG: alpha/beta hydrolase [Microthrixaceae bacterium]|jgi:pimeloyl-ACP methyl ester carboxylesterase
MAVITFDVTDDLSGEGGLRIEADAYGDASARPVLLLHGGGQTRHSWGSTAATLATAGWYAVAYDQRGHGASGRSPSGHYEPGRFAEDLVEIATTFEQPPVVVGASLGGLAALLAEGVLAPGLFAGIVLVDITPRQEREGVNRIVSFMLDRAVEGFGSLDEAADAVAAYQPHRNRPRDHSGLQKNLRLDADGRWRWHWDPELFNSDNGLHAAQEPGRFVAAAAQLTLPTLLVRGKLSDLVSEETAQEFLELVPHAQFVDVSGAGHMVAGDRNDRFCDAVVEFLEALPTT